MIAVIAIAFASIIWYRNQKNKKFYETNVRSLQEITSDSPNQKEWKNQLGFYVYPLQPEDMPDERRLTEITNSNVLACINDLVTEAFQAGNAAANVVKANNQTLYQIIIPPWAKLAKSQDMDRAFRVYYHGANGIKAHVNIKPVNTAADIVANSVASAMGVASIVVGQYYMAQISAEMNKISADISKIKDFQDNEYKSRVLALVAQIQKMAEFKADILDNDELRTSEIANLNNLEQECIQLLGQANLTIVEISKKNALNYAEYEKQLYEVQSWFMYQKTLVKVLFQIAELKHALHLGKVSRKQCNTLLYTYLEQSKDAMSQLESWHMAHIGEFGINLKERKRKRVGLESFIYNIIARINEEKKYRPISDETAKKIVAQINGYDITQKINGIDLYQEDVKIIVKDGKAYYFPQEMAQ